MHKAPEAGVHAVVAVVAHDKEIVGRDGDRTEIVTGGYDIVRLRVTDIAFLDGLSVAVKLLVAYLYYIAGNAYDTLDEIRVRILWILKNYDLSAFRRPAVIDGNISKGDPQAVIKLCCQKLIAHKQGIPH